MSPPLRSHLITYRSVTMDREEACHLAVETKAICAAFGQLAGQAIRQEMVLPQTIDVL